MGSPRKRLIKDLMISYESKSKRQKKEILFERTLNMVSVSSAMDTEEENISTAEANMYRNMFSSIAQKSEKIQESDSCSSDDSCISIRSTF